MTRPQLLLVPGLTELEWRVKPQLEEWADVASYDAPGIGSEPPGRKTGRAAIVERGLEELERRGWERCIVVGDELGGPNAVDVACARPDRVAALALGHACLSYRRAGPRAPIREEVIAALAQLIRTDWRTYVRHLSQVTQHAYDDEWVDRYIDRVPQELGESYFESLLGEADFDVERRLQELRLPLLFVKHDGCLMWTDEGFDDAVAAFTRAATARLRVKPSASEEFSGILRAFCEREVSRTAARTPRPR